MSDGQGGATDEALAADAGYRRFVEANLKRNFLANYVHGMLGMTGFRLVNTPTFVPAWLHALGGSDAAVSLGAALQQIGGVISPIAGAAMIEHRKRILPVSMLLGLMMRLAVLGLALTAWFLAGPAALASALVFLFLLGLFQGPQRVAFQYLLAKVIPVRLRGRLQALRNVTGGLIAAGLSWVAGVWLIGGGVLGDGYGATFFLAFVLTTLGLIGLRALLREPEPPSVREPMAIGRRLRDMPQLIGGDPGFKWFLIARSFAMGSRIAAPFFFLHAAEALGVSASDDPRRFGELLAAFSLAFMLADTALNLLWGWLSDRGGFHSTFVIAMALYLVAMALLAAAHDMPALVLAFFGLGAAQSAYFMASVNIVMEFGQPHDMPMRMAISNTAEGLAGGVAPIIGGALALAFGYGAAFAAALAATAVALVLMLWKVDEPRRRAPG
jgi:MFS family permease